MKKGIAVAGNLIVDQLYPVERFAKAGELATIVRDMRRSTGGCVCNTAVDLAKLDPKMRLAALGRVGTDGAGEYILAQMGKHPNIDLGHIRREGTTSYTLVIADESTNQRTFYQCRGANAAFCEEDIPWEKLDVELLHIGYVLLLDALDEADAEYGTKMARLLHTAQGHGVKTSIDVVTETGDRFRKLVCPALKYTDYCIINEVEAGATTGIELRNADGSLNRENFRRALEKMKALGVSTWAVIHCPELGAGLDDKGNYVEVPSLSLPQGYIKGTVGAGDAFCSGVLYAAWKGQDLRSAIELGTAAAACSLSQPGATEGMRSEGEARTLYDRLRGEEK